MLPKLIGGLDMSARALLNAGVYTMLGDAV